MVICRGALVERVNGIVVGNVLPVYELEVVSKEKVKGPQSQLEFKKKKNLLFITFL